MTPIAFAVEPIDILKKFNSEDLTIFGVSESRVSREFIEFSEKYKITKQKIKDGDPRIVLRGKTLTSNNGVVSCFLYEGDKVEKKNISELKNSAEYRDGKEFSSAQRTRQEALEESRLYAKSNGWKAFQDFFGRENLVRAGRSRMEGTIWKADKYELNLKYYGTTRESNCFVVPTVKIEPFVSDDIPKFIDPELEKEMDEILKYFD